MEDTREAIWHNTSNDLVRRIYICGFCNTEVTSKTGYTEHYYEHQLVICPCGKPTYFDYGIQVTQTPAPLLGNDVHNLPQDINNLYYEIRKCTTINAYTGTVLLCRKLLMNIAVKEGAPTGKKFVYYTEYLSNNFVTKHNKPWVNYIREKGNEAAHEIPSVNKETALKLITFSEMVLKIIYDFPTRYTENER